MQRQAHVMISGSRSLHERKDVESDVYMALDALVEPNQEGIVLLSGNAKGVDRMGEAWARTHQHEVLLFEPNYKMYKRKAPLERNLEMLKKAQHVVVFWDEKSKGTKHVIQNAKRLSLPLKVHTYSCA